MDIGFRRDKTVDGLVRLLPVCSCGTDMLITLFPEKGRFRWLCPKCKFQVILQIEVSRGVMN